jgi:phosphoglycolate phosphatase-like HAD superfamily hydrolase
VVRTRRPRAAILDVGGTLVDSNDAHARAWLDAFRESGFGDVTFDLVRPLIGMSPAGLLPRSIGVTHESELGHRILSRRAHLFSKYYLPGITPFVGARALLMRMKRAGLKVVVASHATEERTWSELVVAGVADLVDEVAVGADGLRATTQEELMETAILRAGQLRDEILLLGDTPYDVSAGQQCGIGVVALRCGGWSDSALAGAAALYDDPRDLLYHFATSPLSPAASLEAVVSPPRWVEPAARHA